MSRTTGKTQIVDKDTGQSVIVNDDGELSVVAGGHVLDANSTATPLTSGSVFTGTSYDILNVSTIIIATFSDVASATDGLAVEWSTDGTNWDGDDVYTVPANKQKTFSFQPVARYIRVVYTNGGTNQTAFRLQTIVKHTNVKPSSHRVQDSIISDDDAELTKSVLTGQDPSGTFQNVNTTQDGDLTISDKSSGLAIARGDVTGSTVVIKFGEAGDIDTADGYVDIWDNVAGVTDKVYTFSTTADIDSLSSSDNGDTFDVEVQGLDSNWDLTIQTITLTGQTPVALTTNLIRVFRMKNVNATNNAGNIFCYVSGGTVTAGVPQVSADIRAVMQIGNNQTLMAIYTIPNGCVGYVVRRWTSLVSKTAGSSSVRSHARPFGGVFQLKYSSSLSSTGSSNVQDLFQVPLKLPAKTDVKLSANSSANNMAVSGGFDIVLEDV